MSNIKFSITAANNVRFFYYAISAIYGLINNGGIDPSDIIFNVSSVCYHLTEPLEKLESMGVVILPLTATPLCKPVYADRVFRYFPEATTVVLVDSDAFLNKTVDLYKVIQQYQEVDCALYISPSKESPKALMLRRDGLFLPDYSYIKGKRELANLQEFALREYSESLDNLLNFAYSQEWFHGGIVIYNRSILTKKAWKEILAWSGICSCDETAFLFAKRAGSDFVWKAIDNNVITHYFTGENMPSFDRSLYKGWMHFAGDWFRCGQQHVEIDKLNAEAYAWLLAYK